ncbi:MAG: LysM peptidoglycan-binding domain-containing protein [Caldilineaceae bacterium]|nr:LysM peptidoglycan-binding domain-containing protein [Caldilineaceae bacterium]
MQPAIYHTHNHHRVPIQYLSKILRITLIVACIAGGLAWAPVARAEDGVHIVTNGESLGFIARRYNVSIRDLVADNGLINPNVIVPGQRLVIPGLAAEADTDNVAARVASAKTLPGGDGYHTVQRGETLSQIAQSSGMTLSDIMRLNALTNANFLWVGQKLRVTARVAPVAPDEEAEPTLAEQIYIVQQGESLADVAKANGTTVQAILQANGLPHENFVWAGQRLRLQAGLKPAIDITSIANAPTNGYRWIEVNLSNQTLTAWQGDTAVMHTYISSGTSATPTVTGRFRIGTKLSSQRMVGPGYDLPGVPWVMYFYQAYAIHGAYWHNNFGMPMSHGCVNMSISEAQALYNWAPAGTEVYVHY